MVSKVMTAKASTTLNKVAGLMNKRKIGSVIISDDRRKVDGIITERDFIRLAAAGVDVKNSPVGEHMSRRVVTCDPRISVVDALMIMRKTGVRHLPVVRKGRGLVGILSLRDLVAATQLASIYLI